MHEDREVQKVSLIGVLGGLDLRVTWRPPVRQCGRVQLCGQTWVPRKLAGKGVSTSEKHLTLSLPISELNAVGAGFNGSAQWSG